MRKQCICMTILLALSVLVLFGCGKGVETLYVTEPGADAGVSDTVDYSTLDVSGVTAVRLSSGYTGEKVWLTDPEDIKAITGLVAQIKGDSPESSRGYYGWTYGIDLYDTENPTEDSQSFWSAGMTWGTFTSNIHYETVKNHRYNTRYRMTGITTEEIDAVCERYFPPMLTEFTYTFQWGTYGISSYDEYTGTLIKTTDTTTPDKYTTRLRLSPETRIEIYEMIAALHIQSYPDIYDPINDPASDVRVESSPPMSLVLTVTTDQWTKTVSCENIAHCWEGYDEKAQAFLDVCKTLQEILTGTDEWKTLPEYENFYQ